MSIDTVQTLCREYLQEHEIPFLFSDSILTETFAQENNPAANAYEIAVKAADKMIVTATPQNTDND